MKIYDLRCIRNEKIIDFDAILMMDLTTEKMSFRHTTEKI